MTTGLERWLNQHSDKLKDNGEVEFHGGVLRWNADEIRIDPVAMEGFRLSESIPGTVSFYRTRQRPEGLGMFTGRGATEWLLIELRDPRAHAVRLSCPLPPGLDTGGLPVRSESSSPVELEQAVALLQTARHLGVQFSQLNLTALQEEERRHEVGAPVKRTDGKAESGSQPTSSDSQTRVQGELHHLSGKPKREWLGTLGRFAGIGLLVAMLISPAWMPASCCIALVGGDWEVKAVGTAGDYLVIGAGDSVGNVTMHLVAVVSLESGELVQTESWRAWVTLEGTGPDFVWVREVGELPVALSVPELEEIYNVEDDLFDARPELEDLFESVRFSDEGLAVIDARDGNYYLVDPRSGEVTSQEDFVANADRTEPGSCSRYHSVPDRVEDWRLFDGKSLCDWTGDNERLVEFRALEGSDSKLRVGLLNDDERFQWVKQESDWLEERDSDESGRRVLWSGTVDGNVVLVLDDGRDVDEIHILAVDEEDGEPVWNVTID